MSTINSTTLATMGRLFVAIEKLTGGVHHRKIENEPFMPLTTEIINKSNAKSKLKYVDVSLAHYYEQNGDLMRDPEMTFRMFTESKIAYPLSFLNDGAGSYLEYCTYDQNGDIEKVATDVWKDGLKFALQWMKNLKKQGFYK